MLALWRGEEMNFKLGQKVRHIESGRDFYVVGIKHLQWHDGGHKTMLIVHEDKSSPTSKGYRVWPFHVELIKK